MPKLQKISRSNGSLNFSVNIPLGVIEDIQWEKGEELSFEIQEVRGRRVIVIFSEEDIING